MTDATVVFDDSGQRAVIFDRETGDVLKCSVPTALENVRLGQGRYVHGSTGDRIRKGAATPPPEPEPVIELVEPDVLDLPVPEPDEPDEEAAKRAADIAAALPLLDEHDFVGTGVRTGKPKCSAIENIVGFPPTAAEVDAAWDARA